jgi:hypothetical protein
MFSPDTRMHATGHLLRVVPCFSLSAWRFSHQTQGVPICF